MICSNCGYDATGEDLYWAEDSPYCVDCFHDLFNHCSRCNTVITIRDTYYDISGDPYCLECYQECCDDDAPDNPDVSQSHIEMIINLSRSWLNGNIERKKTIYINEKDLHLKTIRDNVGLVDNPVYFFGLADREEYQIVASSDLFEKVQEYCLLNQLQAKAVNTHGCKRIGISLSIRQNNQTEIINMIKSVSNVERLVNA